MKEQTLQFSEMKVGSYKKALSDVHRWQSSVKNHKPPVIQFLSWLFGN